MRIPEVSEEEERAVGIPLAVEETVQGSFHLGVGHIAVGGLVRLLGRRIVVQLEALVQVVPRQEVRAAGHPCALVASLGQDLGQCGVGVPQRAQRLDRLMRRGVQAGEDAGVGRQGPTRDRVRVLIDHPLRGQGVEGWTGRPQARVAPDVVGADRLQRDQHDVGRNGRRRLGSAAGENETEQEKQAATAGSPGACLVFHSPDSITAL